MKNKEEFLIREYEKSQDVAEHYNTMIWAVMGGGIALSLGILNEIWNRIDISPTSKTIMTAIGFLIFLYSYNMINSFSQKRLVHYAKANAIEEYLTKEVISTENYLKEIKHPKDIFSNVIAIIIFVVYLVTFMLYGISDNLATNIILFVIFILGLIYLIVTVCNASCNKIDLVKIKKRIKEDLEKFLKQR